MHGNRNKPSAGLASGGWEESSVAFGGQQKRLSTGRRDVEGNGRNGSANRKDLEKRAAGEWQKMGRRGNMDIRVPNSEKEHIRKGPGKKGGVGKVQNKAMQGGKLDVNRALLAEAKKSKPDLFTGMHHCLSCGKSFKQVSALADHLRKHNGVNSGDYKVVQYQQQLAQQKAAPRASKTGFMFGDLLDAAMAKSSKMPSAGRSNKGSRIIVSTMTEHRVVKPKEKVKKVEQAPERMTKEERAKLESAFEGLRLKSELIPVVMMLLRNNAVCLVIYLLSTLYHSRLCPGGRDTKACIEETSGFHNEAASSCRACCCCTEPSYKYCRET